jgi:hypothetical protein
MDLDISRELINALVSMKNHFPFELLFSYYFLRLLFPSKDINECTEGIDNCNRQTQLCLNIPGGYKCQDKAIDKCLPGLQFNSVTSLCEGASLLRD